MELYSVSCPNCYAPLQFGPNDFSVECPYCKGLVYRELSESQQTVMSSRIEIEKIRHVLEKREELIRLNKELEKRNGECRNLEIQTFVVNMPFSYDSNWTSIAAISSPFVLGLFALWALAGKSWIAFFILLVFTVIGFYFMRFGIKILRSAKNSHRIAVENAKVDARNREEERDRTLAGKRLEIEQLKATIEAVKAETTAEWLPERFRGDEALKYLHNSLSLNPGVTIQQVMYQYDLDKKEKELKKEEKRIEARQKQSVQAPVSVPANSVVVPANSAPIPGPPPLLCPVCGRSGLWQQIGAEKGKYNVGAAVVGTLFLGPIGPVFGAIARHNIVKYHCGNCGFGQQYKL